MGYIYAELSLTNPSKPDLKPVNVRALCDSGAIQSCLPAHIANQLGLAFSENREVSTADGAVHNVPYVGPLQIAFDNRKCFTGAFVLGDEVLLGAIEMQAMDVILNPRLEILTVNPASPNIATGKVKGGMKQIWREEEHG